MVISGKSTWVYELGIRDHLNLATTILVYEYCPPIVAARPLLIVYHKQSYLQQFNIQQFGVPYKVTDNGSCLCNSVPLVLCGRVDLATELRVRTCIEIRT